VLIVDAHLDLAMNALYLDRDLARPVAETRAAEKRAVAAGLTDDWGRTRGTVAFPELRAAGVGLVFATLIARVMPPGRVRRDPVIEFATPAVAHAHARGQLAYYRELERQGAVRIVADAAALAAHLRAWDAASDAAPIGLVVAMEGADPIVAPDQLATWHAAGLRLLGLAHYGPSAYAHGTGSPGPLTALGPPLLAEMERLGVILDLTHLAEASFWQALDLYHGPVHASHANCRALVPGDRQLSDEMLRALIARDGVVGTALDAWMLRPGWVIGETTPAGLTLEAVVDQIDHLCQLAGSARHAAIGTDLDGGYGTEQTPSDLDTIADLRRLPDLLAARGYAAPDIALVMGGNWLRLLRHAWGAATVAG
jgi:membrane dipeptidase